MIPRYQLSGAGLKLAEIMRSRQKGIFARDDTWWHPVHGIHVRDWTFQNNAWCTLHNVENWQNCVSAAETPIIILQNGWLNGLI